MKIFLQLILLVTVTSLAAQVSFTSDQNVFNVPNNYPLTECIVDMDGDYIDDVAQVHQQRMDVFHQKEDGSFAQQTKSWAFQYIPDWSMCAGDFDANGFNDLVIGNGSGVSFIIADETGADYTERAFQEYIFSQRSTAFDIDNDGMLDAFVCNDDAINFVYQNMGDGTMVLNTDLLPTADMAGNYSALWVDYNNDRYTDLFLTKCYVFTQSVDDPERINLLYRNNGDGTFTEVGEEANMNDNAQSWTTAFEDFNNDGLFDAFIVNHDFENRMMINQGDGTFIDMIDSTGIDKFDLGAWEASAADFDNDGDLDILSELQDQLYLNNGDLTFTPQKLNISKGAIGDLNNDGFLDVLSGNVAHYNNGNDNNWIKFSTRGLVSNRNGIGARIEIYGDFGLQVREVRSSQSFSPMSSLNVHFGIGQSTAIDSVIVKWPSMIDTKIFNPEINSSHIVVESECTLAAEDIVIEGSLALCEGETVLLTAPDADEYLWSNGATTKSITVSDIGQYSVIYSTGICKGHSNFVNITRNIGEFPLAISQGSSLAICEGDEIFINAVNTQDSLIWNTGETTDSILVSNPGLYTLTSYGDYGCGNLQSTVEISVETLTVSPPMNINAFPNGENNFFIIAEGEGINWFDSPDAINPIGFGSFLAVEIEETTTYYAQSIVVTDNGNCFSELVPITLETSSINDLEENLGLNIFPNPASNILNVNLGNPKAVKAISLMDMTARSLQIIKHNIGFSNIIDASNFASGTYLVEIRTDKNRFVKQVVVE